MSGNIWRSEPNGEPDGKKGSITLACRLDKTLYEILRIESKARDISLNSLINNIAKKYISWEKYAIEIGFVPLARETVKLVFEDLEDGRIKSIAHHLGQTLPREMILLMFNKIDINSIIAFLEITLSRYGMVRHNISGSTHDFVIYHNVSKKFSHFLAAAAETMAKDLSFKLHVLNADSKILTLRIEEINGTSVRSLP